METSAYAHASSAGQFVIALRPDHRWHITWNGEDLGNYRTAQQALDDLTGGHTWSASNGLDTAALGLATDIADWAAHSRD